VVFVNGGRHLLVGHLGGTVALFDLEGTGPTRRIELSQGCRRLVVDASRNRVLAGDNQGGLSVLTLHDLTVVRLVEGLHEGPIRSLGLSPDGRLLATGGHDRRVVLRDPTTFEPWLTFPPWTASVKDLAFDSSGRWLAFGGADTDVALWDLGAVRDELAAVGLAWDQPAPVVTPADRLAAMVQPSSTDVPVIRAVTKDPAVLER
jgi:WD40 repeat protein